MSAPYFIENGTFTQNGSSLRGQQRPASDQAQRAQVAPPIGLEPQPLASAGYQQRVVIATPERPLWTRRQLERSSRSDQDLGPLPVAPRWPQDAPNPVIPEAGLTQAELVYETWGQLSPERDNAVLLLHALTGDSHAAKHHPGDRPGWWDACVGPGLAIDTKRWFVICANALGGCAGSTGPTSINPPSGRPYGADFPLLEVPDLVEAELRLLDALGIQQLRAVIGGSLGGLRALEFGLQAPERAGRVAALCAGPRLSTQGLALSAIQRNAIRADPDFLQGRYALGAGPKAGLAVARQLAHVTYRSEAAFERRFGRRLQDPASGAPSLGVHYAVESYLEHKGQSFVQRFDANSYLRLSRAFDSYDLAARWGPLPEALGRLRAQLLLVSIDSDWLFSPYDSALLAEAARQAGVTVRHAAHSSDEGHDAFLLEHAGIARDLANFLEDTPRQPPAGPVDYGDV